MNKPSVFIFFLFALFAFSLKLFIIPSLNLFTFAPFLAITFQRTPFLKSIWIGAFCGFLIDVFSSSPRFGIFCLSYVLATICTYRFKRHFFEENLLSIPLYTFLIAILLSLIQFFLLLPLSTLSLPFIATTFFVMPLIDALYAFLWFTCPTLFYHLIIQKQQRAL